MGQEDGSGVLRFELPNMAPTSQTIRHKWGVWREIMSGKSAQERAMLLREATLGFGDPAFKGSTLLDHQLRGESRRHRLAMLQERLAAAERKREARLEAVRIRAAARGVARSGAAIASAATAAAGAQKGVMQGLGEEAMPMAPRRLMMDRVADLRASEGSSARPFLKRSHSPRRSASCSPKVFGSNPRTGASPRASASGAFLCPRRPALRRGASGAGAGAGAGAEARRARWVEQLQVAAEAARQRQEGGEAQSPLAAAAELLRRQASSRRVQRLWRTFAAQRKTTRALAADFVACGVTALSSPAANDADDVMPPASPPADSQNRPSVVFVGGVASGQLLPHHERFESFAEKLQAPRTLRAAAALLRRLEARLAARGASLEGAQMLLRQLFPAAAAGGKTVDRYPVRVALVAFMIRDHPEVVFNKVGDVEAHLSAAARSMLGAFEALLSKVVEPATSDAARAAAGSAAGMGAAQGAVQQAATASPLRQGVAAYRRVVEGAAAGEGAGQHVTLGVLLAKFDDEWLEYLDQFVVWKGKDAASLERDLIGIAAKLERSMLRKLAGRDPESEQAQANPDLQAMVSQVRHDHSLLHERVLRLTGPEGVARLDAALQAVREEVEAEMDEAASEASWESASEGVRSRGPSRTSSRAPSRSASTSLHPVNGAKASGDAPQRQQHHQDEEQPQQQPEGTSNEQMVWEMLYNPQFSLPVAEAEAAWGRAIGQQEEEEPEDIDSMSPEQLAAAVSRRARAIAERAFWDSLEWRFATAIQGGGLPSQIAPLISELGLELASLLSSGGDGAALEAAQLAEQYQEPRVLARLASRSGRQGGGANLTAALSALEQLGRCVLRSAAPARAEEAAAPFAEAQRALVEAAGLDEAGGAGEDVQHPTEGAEAADSAARAAALARALAPALARALRLTMAQIKIAKLDAANARLSMLAAAMRERGAVSYLKGKLAASWQLPEAGSPAFTKQAVAERLPRTAAWMASLSSDASDEMQQEQEQQAGGELPALRRALAAAGLDLNASAAAAAVVASGLPTAPLRTGLRVSPASPGGAAAAAATAGAPSPRDAFGLSAGSGAASGVSHAEGALRPAFPVLMASWQGAFRAALVVLLARDAPAAGPLAPEVLLYDKERLHAAQNGLQQLIVAASALLIAQQLRAAAGAPAWAHDARVAARRRLMVVLSDPAMKLSDLVTEIARMTNDGAPQPVDEERVRGMFTSIVNPESAAFKSVGSALCAALLAHALYGRAALAQEGDVGRAAGAALARVGAGVLFEDVRALGERVAAVAGVVEAVWGDALGVLFAGAGQ